MVATFYKNHYKAIYAVIFGLLAVWHLWSLPISPLAWYDEAVFADITHSIISGKGFLLDMEGGYQEYVYGPVYFGLTALSTYIAGFDIFQFRINMIFSVLTLVVFYKMCRKLELTEPVVLFLVLLFSLDTLFVQNAHSGRMEFVALFFAIFAYYVYMWERNDGYTLSRVLCFAVMVTLSVLTTPRVAIVLLPVCLLQFVDLLKKNKILFCTYYVLIPILSFLLWVYLSYGSIEALIDYYTHPLVSSDGAPITAYLGGNLLIYTYQYPLLLLVLFVVAISVFQNTFAKYVLYLSVIVLFYLAVADSGFYCTFLLPFFYFVVAMGWKDFVNSHHVGKWAFTFKSLVILCVLTNVGIFTMKAVTVATTSGERNIQPVHEWIARSVPQGSKLTGSDSYIYSILKNDCRFRRAMNLNSEVNQMSDEYTPDYLILLDNEQDPHVLDYIRDYDVEEVSKYTAIRTESKLISKIQALTNVRFGSAYDGVLYKIKKN